MSEIAIQFEHVTKRYHRESPVGDGLKSLVLHLPTHLRRMWRRRPEIALDDVSFEVRAGECLGVIGRNGAGKSTMLGLMAGVLRPSSGTVRSVGRICPLLELGAGFHMELSGLENVILNAVLLGLTRREARERQAAIIEFAELEHCIDQPLRTYSSGMVARLGFAVAVHLDPRILLVDEALSVGDDHFQRKCLGRIHQFRAEGVTIIFVSHDLGAVRTISDRVALVERGRLVTIGEPHPMIDHYQSGAQAA